MCDNRLYFCYKVSKVKPQLLISQNERKSVRSETSIVVAGLHLQEWTVKVRECQSRPAGMSIARWCADNGITKANYYYRLRRVRKVCIEHIREEIPAQQIVPVELVLLQ